MRRSSPQGHRSARPPRGRSTSPATGETAGARPRPPVQEPSALRYGRAFLWSAAILAVGSLACQQPNTARFADGQDRYVPPAWAPPEFTAPAPAPAARRPLPPAPAPQAQTASAVSFPRSWTPTAAPRPWRFIVIHHSATPSGGAAEFDRLHRNANGWDELGYHFVIGNGTDTQNGAIEVGPRWPKQKHGAHAKTDDNRFNNFGIGICLVGNFDTANPTPEQMRSLTVLVAFLMQKYDIPPQAVIGHHDTGKATACPGKALEAQLPTVRRLAARAVANGFAADPTPRPDTPGPTATAITPTPTSTTPVSPSLPLLSVTR